MDAATPEPDGIGDGADVEDEPHATETPNSRVHKCEPEGHVATSFQWVATQSRCPPVERPVRFFY
jgi:hypothetical protein